MLSWLRRLVAAPLILLALICTIGAVRMFRNDIEDSSFSGGAFAAVFAAVFAVGAVLLLRPDLRRLRAPSWIALRHWLLRDPLGQAVVAYAVAAVLMIASPTYQLLPGFLVFCAYSLVSAMTAALGQRWWRDVGLGFLGWILLFFALAWTSEALSPRGFGEGAMVFLAPIMWYPVLLALSGVIRLARRR